MTDRTQQFGRPQRVRIALILLCAAAGSAANDKLPLEPARTLSFNVSEGTWLSLDVRPDGREIVFDLLGDLYVLPVAGGRAQRIRGGMAFDAQPAYSPGGESIAFLSDASGTENLWIAAADGSSPRRLSSWTDMSRLSSPAWSADGRSVYVSRRSNGRRGVFELWQHHLSGGEGLRIGGGEEDGRHVLGVTVGGAGRYLYTGERPTAAVSQYYIPEWTIVRRDLVTGESQQAVTALYGALRPTLSPDGRRLVYGMRRDGQTGFRLRDLESGKDRWLAWPVQRDNADETFNRDLLPGYAFTPDGEALIAAWGGHIRRIDVDTGDIRTIPFEAAVELGIGPSLIRNVPAETGPVRARIAQQPVLSPDGRQVAFSAFARIYVADVDGSRIRAITDGDLPAFQPAWSPGGRSLAWVTWTAKNAGHVWRQRVGGGRPEKLTQHADFYSDPVFSHDGAEIFALRSNHTERLRLQEEVTPKRFPDLVAIPADGGDARVIMHAGIGAGRPYLTDDPARIFLTTAKGVESVRADGRDGKGTDRRLHVVVKGLHAWMNPGHPRPVSEVQLSPDGRWLLAATAGQLYLAAVPPAGGEAPEVDLSGKPGWPWMRLSRHGADYFGWSHDGRTLVWSLGSTLFRLPLDAVDPGAGDLVEGEDAISAIDLVVELPRDVPAGALLLRGATVITMEGDEVIDDADLLVRGNRIAGIAPRGGIAIPRGATVREIEDAFVVPGFVDTHAHWYEIRHDVLDTRNWSFLAALAFGITSGLDVQAMDQDMFAYQDMIDAGIVTGPRAWSVGKGMFWNTRIDSATEATDLVRRYTDFYRTPNVKSYLAGNRRQRQWIAQASAELGAIATTEGAGDMKLDLTHAIDGFAGNEHQLPIAPLYDDVVRLFAETRIGYTPTLMITSDSGAPAKSQFIVEESPHDDPKVRRFMPHFVNDTRSSRIQWVRPDERHYPRIAESAGKILRAGGNIGIGSHAEFQGVAYHWEMQAFAAGGLTPTEILRAATVLGSRIIGRADDVGTIAPGKFADLVILDSDPREDVRNAREIRHVMKNGRLYDGETLDELWPRQQSRPPLWHRETMPAERSDDGHEQ